MIVHETQSIKKVHAYFVYVLYSVNIRIACHKQEGETLSVLDVLPSLTFKLLNGKCFKWNLMHSMSKWCKNSIGPTSVVLILERSESAAVNVSVVGPKKKKERGHRFNDYIKCKNQKIKDANSFIGSVDHHSVNKREYLKRIMQR